MNDYYRLLNQIKRDDKYSYDNDLKYFRSEIKTKRRNVQPSDYFYHDTYNSFYNDCRPITLHDDIVNFCDYRGDYNYPWKPGSSERIIGVVRRGRNYDQPIFNDDLINELQLRRKSVIYSKRK